MTIENHGWYIDYDNEPNSQNVGIWTQFNGYGRIFDDIGCIMLLEHQIDKIRMSKSVTFAKKRGVQGVKRER